MARDAVVAAGKPMRELLEALGLPLAFRKLYGILNALEMQVEDGHYQHHAVTRLCEALLATAELYDIPDELAARLQELACGVIDRAKRR